MGTNIVLLLALIGMIAIWIYLFRDGEGTIRTGRLTGKLRGSVPGQTIRIKASPPREETSVDSKEAEAKTDAVGTKG